MAVHELAPERDLRGPGCSDACRVVRVFQAGVFGRGELLLHDPESHERYGRRVAGDATAFDLIETGTLSIHRAAAAVWVEGQPSALTATEWRLLACLADRLGAFVPYAEIIRTAWPGWGHRELVTSDGLIGTHLARLRAKLGPAGGLIETYSGYGLRLRLWPLGEPAPPVLSHGGGPPLPPGRWAREYDRCQCCGTTSSPHGGHGLCDRCRQRYGRRRAGAS